MLTTCPIGLGGNLGDRMGNLAAAVEHLAATPAVFLRAVSRVYETEPVGPPQPRYLNAVAQVDTLLSPRALLKVLLGIEEKMGRFRAERWSAREIDLDLLFFGDRVLKEPQLEVPHPRLHERAFVLGPLCDLAPALLHPVLGASALSLWLALPEAERASVRAIGPLRRRYDLPAEDEGEGEPGAAGGAPRGPARPG